MKRRVSVTRRWSLADEDTLGASGIDDAERRRRSDAMQAWWRLVLACEAALGHKATTTL